MGAPGRLFFALWPDEPVRRELAAWAHAVNRETGGRVTRADTIHLTLLFLGEVEAERFDSVRQLGTGVSASAFDLSIDTAGCWKHNRIAWAAPSSIPQPLAMLAAQLSAGGEAAGFEPDPRPYKPHVTLLRKARCRPLQWTPSAPIEWRVERFVLVRSILDREGAIYEEMADWPLKT